MLETGLVNSQAQAPINNATSDRHRLIGILLYTVSLCVPTSAQRCIELWFIEIVSDFGPLFSYTS